MLPLIELHHNHDEDTGQQHHFARHAALAARHFIGEEKFKDAERTCRAANRAKHSLTALTTTLSSNEEAANRNAANRAAVESPWALT